MIKSIILNITRPNGETEKIEVLEKFHKMDQKLFNMVKEQTQKAKRGVVNSAKIIETKSNIKELIKKYNDLHNEGGEGYIPDNEEYWTSQPDYKTWEKETVIR